MFLKSQSNGIKIVDFYKWYDFGPVSVSFFYSVFITWILKLQNAHFMKKIPKGAEASNILVGELNVLDKPLSAFIRLSEAAILGDLTEVPVPTRFIFILLGPAVSLF